MDTKSPFVYTVATNKDFKQTVEDLEEKIREKGLRVAMVHDMQGILFGKRHKIPLCKMKVVCHDWSLVLPILPLDTGYFFDLKTRKSGVSYVL